jgi:subtilisin family serine protease
MIMIKICLTILLSLACLFQGNAQGFQSDWFNLDATKDSVEGLSVELFYSRSETVGLQPVVVAVIDDGVDVFHQDLKGKIWINEAEIPDNSIDDDKNGYVDDIYGWNYLGNPTGENIKYENLEITRLYRDYKGQFDGQDAANLSKAEKSKYKEYLEIESVYKEAYDEVNGQFNEYAQLAALYEGASNYVMERDSLSELTMEDIMAFQPLDEDEEQIQNFLVVARQQGLLEYLESAGDYLNEAISYHYNLDFNPRDIVNESEAAVLGIAYGNNMVWAENPEHGTHVSGIIGAKRGNAKGINGVASNARIMALRAVPNGDERDEDIANAIRYAVDNGALVVNMSFGKSYSPQHELVWEAIQYAKDNDVLLIHAAGNDGLNIDKYGNFPNGTMGKKYSIDNWITVGASSLYADSTLIAPFSNYGRQQVDVLAPGVEILSLTPNDGTDSFSGTSMAAPVITGMAVVLRGAYPALTAKQIKQIIIESVQDEGKLVVNVDNESIKLKKVIRYPGIPNLEKALAIGAKM